MRRSRLFLLLVLLLAGQSRGDDIRLPDASKGHVDGKVALLFWPAIGIRDGKWERLLPAEECDVHIIPVADRDRELTRPCGRWFLLPEGRYRFWVEKDTWISNDPGLFTYTPAPFDGQGMGSVVPLVPAGRVTLAPTVRLDPNTGVRILRVDRGTGGWPHRAFDRRVAPEHVRTGVLMPAGKAVVGVFDRRTDDAVALSPPITVEQGKTAVGVPEPPAEGSDVLLVLDRPRLRSSWEQDEVTVTLDQRAPDVFLSAADRVFAVWYRIKQDTARLELQSRTLSFDAREVKLLPGRVVTIRGKLGVRPRVSVSIHGPRDSLEHEPLTLEARRSGEKRPLRSLSVRPGETHILESLPSESLDIALQIGPWDIRERVDLSRGVDEFVTFTLQPIVLSGTVYYGRDPAPHAEIAFELHRGFARATADETGAYRLTLWQPRGDYFAQIRIPGQKHQPFLDGFLLVERDTTIDFHVPRTDYVVRVTNAKTGIPVKDAEVIAFNRWSDPSTGEKRVSQATISDDRGEARLQPLRPGELSLLIKAAGFVSGKPQDRVVASVEASERIDVHLQPAGETVPVRLLLADGRPATGAEAWAVRSTEAPDPMLWQGRATNAGMLEVPRDVTDALFLVRHPDAGSAIRTIARDSQETERWTLPSAASPLSIATEHRPTGGRGARIAVWIDALRVRGPALSFLTWSYEATDPGGVWTARNLPPQTLRILAWTRTPEVEITSGLHDFRSASLAYPWQPGAKIPAID